MLAANGGGTDDVIEADIAIIGPGAAGMTLLARLGAAQAALTVVMIDDDAWQAHERSWAWWSRGDLWIDATATAVHPRATAAGHGWSRTFALAPY